jgi:hypothetical protein
MSDKGKPDQVKDATVGLKSDLKTLRQLTSSSEAAKKHREASKDERAKRNLEEAVERTLRQQDEGPRYNSGK